MIGSNKTAVCCASGHGAPHDALSVFLGLFVLGISAIGAHRASFHASAGSGSAATYLQDGRPLPPIGYVNANVALWMMGTILAGFAPGQPETRQSADPGRNDRLRCIAPATCTAVARHAPRGRAFPSYRTVAARAPAGSRRAPFYRQTPSGGAPRFLPKSQTPASPFFGCCKSASNGIRICLCLARHSPGSPGHSRTDDRRSGVPPPAGRSDRSCDSRGHPRRGQPAGRPLDGRASTALGRPAPGADFIRDSPVDHQGQLRFTGSLGTDRYLQWRVAVVQFLSVFVGLGDRVGFFVVPYTLMRNTDYIDARYPDRPRCDSSVSSA